VDSVTHRGKPLGVSAHVRKLFRFGLLAAFFCPPLVAMDVCSARFLPWPVINRLVATLPRRLNSKSLNRTEKLAQQNERYQNWQHQYRAATRFLLLADDLEGAITENFAANAELKKIIEKWRSHDPELAQALGSVEGVTWDKVKLSNFEYAAFNVQLVTFYFQRLHHFLMQSRPVPTLYEEFTPSEKSTAVQAALAHKFFRESPEIGENRLPSFEQRRQLSRTAGMIELGLVRVAPLFKEFLAMHDDALAELAIEPLPNYFGVLKTLSYVFADPGRL
jgi:hypothetical protein